MVIGHEAITLRPARVEDAAAIARIWHEGWGDGHLGHVPEALVPLRTRESFDARAPERIGDTVVAVVDEGGREGAGEAGTVDGVVAGFVMVVEDEVEQVYVAKRHRGTGVADLLLAEAERLVGANGHERAWLAVVAGNARARSFYQRHGWVDEGSFDYPAPSSEGPIPVPCHRYVKRVAGPTA